MSQKESHIVTAIKGYLQIEENLGHLVYQRNNSGASCLQYGGKTRFFRYGKEGAPDFLIYLKDGLTIHCEVKTEKGKLSDNQLSYKRRIENLGHFYVVVRSCYELERLLNGECEVQR